MSVADVKSNWNHKWNITKNHHLEPNDPITFSCNTNENYSVTLKHSLSENSRPIPSLSSDSIDYTTFGQIFTPLCWLEESTLVVKNQNHSANFGQLELTDCTESCIIYNGHRFLSFRLWLESVRGSQTCWYFEPILWQYCFYSLCLS